MIYIGIDPGKNGGIAVLTPEIGGVIAEAYKYSDDKLIEVIKTSEGKARACVERVAARPTGRCEYVQLRAVLRSDKGHFTGARRAVYDSYAAEVEEVPTGHQRQRHINRQGQRTIPRS